jgi:hypothetical protein
LTLPAPLSNLEASLYQAFGSGLYLFTLSLEGQLGQINGGYVMHCLSSRVLSAFLIFGLITLPANAAVTTPLGVIVVAQQAQVGSSAAVSGSTVYQGDRLATGETGQLQVRFGGTQARFLPGSLAVMSQTAKGVNADLLSGSVHLASTSGATFSLSANQAVVRPVASQDVVAQVTRVSPSELLLRSSKGALEVTFDGEVTTLEAGSSYRMLLDPAAVPQGPVGTRPAGRSKRRAIFIVVGAAAAVTGIAIAAVGSSSSSPVSPSAP